MTEDGKHRKPRAMCEQAYSFNSYTCDDPECGLHLIAERQNGSNICEIVIGRDQLLSLLRYIHDEGLDL